MLPKLTSNFYKVKLPVAKREIKYRPWLQGEETRLLRAKGVAHELDKAEKHDESEAVIAEAITEITSVVTNGAVDGNTDSYVDVLYVFMLARARGVSESSDITFDCGCEQKGTVRGRASISNIKVEMPEVETDFAVGIDDNQNEVRVTLGALSFNDFHESKSSRDDLVLIRRCIKKIYTDESTYDLDTVTDDEWLGWYNSLPSSAYGKIEAFIANPPRATCKVVGMCDKCKKTVDKTLSGMSNFL